jgi:hypothetical protein
MRQPERLVFLVGIAGLSLVCIGARAQSDQELLAAARACSGISDDTERLACLDAALGGGDVGDDVAVVAPIEPKPDVVVETIEVDAGSVAVEAASSRNVSDRDRRRASEDEVERMVRIVEIRRSGLGVATFVAENGESWVERSRSTVRFPQVPFDAMLRPAMGDSYFLISASTNSRARVVPVR